MTDATESHPALGILGQIRTLSSDLTAQERSRFCDVLAAAQTDLDTLSPDPTVGNVRLVLDWVQLHAGKNSLRTLHNFLDDAAQFLAFIGARPIIETLQTSARETLYPVDKPVDSLGRYFWTLRSLYWLATRTERECDLPPALRYHHRGKLRARYVLTQSDLQNLIRALGDEGALPVTSSFWPGNMTGFAPRLFSDASAA